MYRCNVCNGMKQVLGLGNILKDCDNCHGAGFVKKEPKESNIVDSNNNVVKIKYKPKGRPKKIVINDESTQL